MTKKQRKRKLRKLFRRDGNKCYYCSKTLSYKTATLDHLIPVSLKRMNSTSNLVLSCRKCNKKKGATLYPSVWEKLKENGFDLSNFLRWAIINV